MNRLPVKVERFTEVSGSIRYTTLLGKVLFLISYATIEEDISAN